MFQSAKKNWFALSLILSLLIHLFLLVYFIYAPSLTENKIIPPHEYVPAYTYPAKASHAYRERAASKAAAVTKAKQQIVAQEKVQKDVQPLKKMQQPKPSLLAASLNMLNDEQRRAMNSQQEADPIYMIGDTSQPADPLLKLLAKALSAHFEYPRIAGEFGIKGRALLGMTLHPDGSLTDVQVLSSSQNRDLDAAALYAVNAAPQVTGAGHFITEPKRFIIGFIFR